MPTDVEIQGEPLPKAIYDQRTTAEGESARRNRIAMVRARSELHSQTMLGTDGRMHGPLQPATIINFNPVSLFVGGQLKFRIPACNQPGSKTTWQFNRGGRTHVGSYVTFRDADYCMSTTGQNDRPDLGYASPTLDVRYLRPIEIAWHFWRQYSHEDGDAQKVGGVLIFDGDIHELDEDRLAKNGNVVWVPESYVIPETKGEIAFRLRKSHLYDELERLIDMQVEFCSGVCQRAHELFNAKDDISPKQITQVHRKWGVFAVEMGYLKERQKWMEERPNAMATAAALKTCPICRVTTTDNDKVMCGPCQAPYDEECLVECVKRGYPIAESYIDALDPNGDAYREVMEIKIEHANRREERMALLSSGEMKPSGRDGGKKGK